MKNFRKAANFRQLMTGILCILGITVSGQNKLEQYRSFFQTNSDLKHWASTVPGFQLSAFKYNHRSDFENIVIDEHLKHNDQPYLQTYGKLISYAPDKKKYLDFYSGQIVFDTLQVDGKKEVKVSADVDQYLFLGNYATHTTTRILFTGAASTIEEAAWISDTAFILAGTKYDGRYFYPFVYIGDVKKQQFYCYLPENTQLKRDSVYRSPKWKLLKGVTL
jgi:hypothetical protein